MASDNCRYVVFFRSKSGGDSWGVTKSFANNLRDRGYCHHWSEIQSTIYGNNMAMVLIPTWSYQYAKDMAKFFRDSYGQPKTLMIDALTGSSSWL